ncbi:hypothetical protein HY950_00370 [Candidatus Gottesmanbacteria bacterium]|nr:hypothetical protein [Candidatus Gottesmanbacteria bacterium]
MFRLYLARHQGAERESALVSEEVLRPSTHWVKVLGMVDVPPDMNLEAGETSQLEDCPGSNVELSEIEQDVTGIVRGACSVCHKSFIREEEGYPFEPIHEGESLLSEAQYAAAVKAVESAS